jgi:hypothetical protein
VGLAEDLDPDQGVQQGLGRFLVYLKEKRGDGDAGDEGFLHDYCHFEFEGQKRQNLLVPAEREEQTRFAIHAHVRLLQKHGSIYLDIKFSRIGIADHRMTTTHQSLPETQQIVYRYGGFTKGIQIINPARMKRRLFAMILY